MSTKVGVGESRAGESYSAGAEAASLALDHGGMERCDFVLVFATVGYDQEALIAGVRSITGEALLSGCSEEGIITQGGPAGEVTFSLSGADAGEDVVALMAFSSDEMTFHTFTAEKLSGGSNAAGASIGEQLRALEPESPRVLLSFPDVYTANPAQFFDGVASAFGRTLPIAGGLAGHNRLLSSATVQYHNDRVLTDAVSCVLLCGAATVDIGVSHGCVPVGVEKAVTSSEGNTVRQIDGQSAWSFFKEYLGDDVEQVDSEVATSLSLGIRLPAELAAEYDPYLVCAPLMRNSDDSITFTTEVPQGSSVVLERRDEQKISDGARALALRMHENQNGRTALAVLHFDCAGRGSMLFGAKAKELGIDPMQEVFGKNTPWLGAYCFGEIAPIKETNYCHNHTAVLCVIYDE